MAEEGLRTLVVELERRQWVKDAALGVLRLSSFVAAKVLRMLEWGSDQGRVSPRTEPADAG